MTRNKTFYFGGFVIVNEAGQFFNSRNGKLDNDLQQHYIYWDRNKAEEVAKGYGLKVESVDIDVKVSFPK
jgi:hypothetical protein